MVSVLEDDIPMEYIENHAKAIGNSLINRFINTFRFRSLDERFGEDEGFTLLDTLVDERSSSWLEKMGATAW